MKWLLFFLGVGLLAYFMVSSPHRRQCEPITIETPSNETIVVEIAASPIQKARGLSNRDTLLPRHGMLFLFNQSDNHSFWMKDTRIPLDIIWLQNKQVMEIATLPPQYETFVAQHTPHNKADAVLELNAGESQQLGITIGAILDWETQCQ